MSNFTGAMVIFVMIVVVAISTIAISAAYSSQYQGAINDSVNNSGISNDTFTKVVKPMSKGITDSTPASILVGLLIAIIAMVMVIWAILKRDN